MQLSLSKTWKENLINIKFRDEKNNNNNNFLFKLTNKVDFLQVNGSTIRKPSLQDRLVLVCTDRIPSHKLDKYCPCTPENIKDAHSLQSTHKKREDRFNIKKKVMINFPNAFSHNRNIIYTNIFIFYILCFLLHIEYLFYFIQSRKMF